MSQIFSSYQSPEEIVVSRVSSASNLQIPKYNISFDAQYKNQPEILSINGFRWLRFPTKTYLCDPAMGLVYRMKAYFQPA